MVLYRKYRPKTFSEIIGQEHIVRVLTNSLKEGIVSHGYLFSGPHGIGKTTLARLFAKSLNCQNRNSGQAPHNNGLSAGQAPHNNGLSAGQSPHNNGLSAGQAEPCNKCDSCNEINQGSALDLVEIDAATYTGVDNIRELQDEMRFLPSKSKYKVFIIDEAHQLSKGAVSALLKTLEEPPSHVIFILATTDFYRILPTIVSRCQSFFLKKLDLRQIIKRLEYILKMENIAFEPNALKLIALSCSGSLRDAESLLDEVVAFTEKGKPISEETIKVLLGLADTKSVFEFLDFLANKKSKEAVVFINNLLDRGVDLREFIKAALAFFREMLFLKIGVESQSALFLSLTEEEEQKLINLSQSFSDGQIKNILEILMDAQNKIKYASFIQLPLELAVVDICELAQ